MRPWLPLVVWVLFVLVAGPAGADEPPKDAPPAEAPSLRTPPPQDAAVLVEAMKSEDWEVRLEAFREAAGRQDEVLLAPLLKGVKDPDHNVRLTAIAGLARREEKGAKKKAAAALEPRLKPLLENLAAREEVEAVIRALHDLAQPSSIRPLLDDLTVHTEREVARLSAFAVANIPSLDAIEALIDLGSRGRNRGSGGQREIARDALVYATGGVKAGDLDGWHVWWSKNRKTFDVEAAAAARAEARAREAAKKAKAEEEKRKREEKRREKKDGAPDDGKVPPRES